MANPNWRPGISGNPEGPRIRNKRSIRSVKGMVERFVKRNITPHKLQKMYDSLKPKEQLDFLVELLPYAASKQPTQIDVGLEKLSDQQLNQLHDDVMAGLMQSIVIPVEQKVPLQLPQPTDDNKEFLRVNKYK